MGEKTVDMVPQDARLARALQHMPDAHLQPDPQVGRSVLKAAEQALGDDCVSVVPPQPFRALGLWQWWVGKSGQRKPLAGALASLLVASFIVALWYGHDLPDMERQSEGVAAKRHGAAPKETAQLSKSDSQTEEPAKPAAKLMAAPAPAPTGVQVLQEGQLRLLASTEAAPLLAALRGLPMQGDASISAESDKRGPLAPNASAERVVGSLGRLGEGDIPFTVQTADGEQWVVSATGVRAITGGVLSTSPLTRAQWLHLRRLAGYATAP